MKLLIASDLHGSRGASEKLVSLENHFNFYKIFLLGDIGYSGARNVPPIDYYPIDVYKNLNEIKDKLVIIRGNCDSRVDEYVLNKKFYDKKVLKISGYKFYLTHGDIYNESSFNLKENDFYLYGHTHVYELTNKEYIVLNPGSLSLPKINKEKTYIIIDLAEREITLYDFDDKPLKTLNF